MLITEEWTYSGGFESGQRSGEGELNYHDGRLKYFGTWRDDEFEEQGGMLLS